MDNFDLKKYLAEGRLLKEDFPNQKYYDLLNDLRDAGLLNKSGVSGLQSKFNLSKEKAKEIFDEYLEDLEAEQPDAFDFFMRDLNELYDGGFIDEMDLDDRLEDIHYEWEKWRENTSPDPRDITTAKRDVIQYIVNYLKRSLK
jgi:hypothetical protein